MKQAGNDTRIIRDEKGNPWGLFLAANFTAEHEFGIAQLLSTLNIDRNGKRTKGRSMTDGFKIAMAKGQVTQTYYESGAKPKKQTDKVTYLSLFEEKIATADQRKYNCQRYKIDDDITGAWDGREFKVAAWNEDAADFLKRVMEAAGSADLTVWTGNTPENNANPFSRAGLIIAVTSLMPQGAKDAIDEADDEADRLAAAVEETGIRAKLIENGPALGSYNIGPPYHALAARFVTEGKITESDTAHPVTFFLNPVNQKKYNHGWFTVEELEQWIEGKGPIMKDEKAA